MVYSDLPCPKGAEFELVNREEWGASHLPVGRRLDSNNVIHVLIEHTATENCFNLTACKMFVYNYQKMWQQQQNTDIPFNFLIGGDGRAYEARGWSVQSEQQFIPSNSSISIAFIGKLLHTKYKFGLILTFFLLKKKGTSPKLHHLKSRQVREMLLFRS